MSFDASPEASSDEEQNEQNEQVEDVEDEENVEDDGDGDGDGDGEDDDDGDGESDEERTLNEGNNTTMRAPNLSKQEPRTFQESRAGPNGVQSVSREAGTAHEHGSAGLSAGQEGPSVTLTSPSPQASNSAENVGTIHPSIRPEVIAATVYDIVPTIAAPQRGADGYIRKFNWVDTANGKLMLTVAQRHPFVDSVTKAGVLSSYWENEDPRAKPNEEGQTLSPVHSLAVHSEGLWLLSGLETGAINLQSVRHDEGKRIHCLKKHTSAVSVLNLASDERSVLSGSWDRTVLDWDLNSGQVIRSFDDGSGQVSVLEVRPQSSVPVPQQAPEAQAASVTFSSNNASKPRPSQDAAPELFAPDGADPFGLEDGAPNSAPSPGGSLFGDNDHDSLFGDDDNNPPSAAAANFGGDDDDEFSRAIADGLETAGPVDGEGDVTMTEPGHDQPPFLSTNDAHQDLDASDMFGTAAADNGNPTIEPSNGFPHADEMDTDTAQPRTDTGSGEGPQAPAEGTVFLAASIDGSLRVWDKRKPTPAAKLVSKGVPQWCMGACWSPDGNFIYAGRRNGSVEEFSLHKGLRGAERTFRFPNGSGPVSAVRAMPNGRHLICASYDILRLYDLQHEPSKTSSGPPFLIVPGHRTGVISQLYMDSTYRFMISAAGNRGWGGTTTQVLLGYEINV